MSISCSVCEQGGVTVPSGELHSLTLAYFKNRRKRFVSRREHFVSSSSGSDTPTTSTDRQPTCHFLNHACNHRQGKGTCRIVCNLCNVRCFSQLLLFHNVEMTPPPPPIQAYRPHPWEAATVATGRHAPSYMPRDFGMIKGALANAIKIHACD